MLTYKQALMAIRSIIKSHDYGWWNIIYYLNIFCNQETFYLSDKWNSHHP
jgi:hypothetical protein